ncbi:MAG: phosphotransferase [Bacteroidota bacterium]
MTKYPVVPGKGSNSLRAQQDRIDFLKDIGIDIPFIADARVDDQIQHNIESYIGSVEIPLGLVGPLLMNTQGVQELVYAPAGTLEGALVASMNRGAKVVSHSGGFNAVLLHQRMVRSPMFIFKNLEECVVFKNWVTQRFYEIKSIAERYSNHASLQEIQPIIAHRSVHLKMIYQTGDAAGQNMTTTCTANSIRWIYENFTRAYAIEPEQMVIEGNAASDKKVSHFSIQQGRGIHVVAECELTDQAIERILRVKSEDMLTALQQSQTMSRMDGMIGYNINITNALAAVFVATGQDLASIHESGVGILNMEKTERGVYCTLHLPALTIGTVGGGTQLLRQKEALRMMDCAGKGKVERFAKIIAGLALALEVSTFAAIVGGQFAKAHESMGRNKPKNWLTKGEIDFDFLKNALNEDYQNQFKGFYFLEKKLVDNGLIINLTSRVNNKLTGFIPLELQLKNKAHFQVRDQKVLLKSKPLDREVIRGLRVMSASIDPNLSDLFLEYQDHLEFKNCHLKELLLYRLLDEGGLEITPRYFGNYVEREREIYILLMELLEEKKLKIFNAENTPNSWDTHSIQNVIQTIHRVHHFFLDFPMEKMCCSIPAFAPWKAKPLYLKLIELIAKDYHDVSWRHLIPQLRKFVDELEGDHQKIELPKTIIHNDCNPRNLAVRTNDVVCIYDWELAVKNFPHRDIVEFLSFSLPLNFSVNVLLRFLEFHFSLQENDNKWTEWKKGYSYALKEFLVTRVTFYLAGKIVLNHAFAERVFLNALRMLDILNEKSCL